MKKSYFLFKLLFTSILIISCKEDEVITEPTLNSFGGYTLL
jgi:hypothetical protein